MRERDPPRLLGRDRAAESYLRTIACCTCNRRRARSRCHRERGAGQMNQDKSGSACDSTILARGGVNLVAQSLRNALCRYRFAAITDDVIKVPRRPAVGVDQPAVAFSNRTTDRDLLSRAGGT